MKTRRWIRMAGWLLTLVMLLTVFTAATYAEDNGGNQETSDYYKPTGELLTRPAEVDITESVKFSYKDKDGKEITVAKMDPNTENRMTLKVSGLNGNQSIAKETVMSVTVPENVKVTAKGLQNFSSETVNVELADDKLQFTWKDEKQDGLEATFTILPHLPTENDLSGNYALVTKTSVMVGSEPYTDGGRKKIRSLKVEESEGLINLEPSKRSVWTLKHVSGDYYTVYSVNGQKYLKIVPEKNIEMVDVSEDDAQKILVTKTADGYYTFQYNKKNLNNTGNNAASGFACYTAGSAENEIFSLVSPSSFVYYEALSFDINGGTGDTKPESIRAEAGTKVTLPDLNATKNGNKFVGWCEVNSVYLKKAGTNHTYHDVYKPGTTYTMKNGTNTLYAIYNDKGTKKVRFGIRKDGIIQDEPNGYDVKNYIGHFEQELDILKETHWVIDIDSTKPVNGYYVVNDVTANLNYMPSAETIAKALQDEGKVDFDPETQYIHYYVMKCVEDTTWKIDGVIRNKAKVGVTYDANVPAGVDKTQVKNMPGGYQVVPGTDILIGADENSTEIKRATLNGYFFRGWNTAKDGSGTYYSEKTKVHLTENLYLYAQWISQEDEVLEIRISSDWTKGAMGYIGAKITLFGELTGFENRNYTLQWQYSTDLVNWVDVPGANDINYTYTLDELTTTYTWRLVARDIT